jgi:hypothetical protein
MCGTPLLSRTMVTGAPIPITRTLPIIPAGANSLLRIARKIMTVSGIRHKAESNAHFAAEITRIPGSLRDGLADAPRPHIRPDCLYVFEAFRLGSVFPCVSPAGRDVPLVRPDRILLFVIENDPVDRFAALGRRFHCRIISESSNDQRKASSKVRTAKGTFGLACAVDAMNRKEPVGTAVKGTLDSITG